MSHRALITATLFAAGCSASPVEPPSAPSAPSEGQPSLRLGRSSGGASRGYQTVARPCRQDSLFVDVPVHFAVPWSSLAFVPRLVNDLEAEIAANQQAWFCDQPGCLEEPVRVVVAPVLTARSGPGREDGHLRFLRVRFETAESGQRVELVDAGQCSAVETLRDRVARAAGIQDDRYWVGRECDAFAASLESQPTSEMQTWHLEAIGLGAGAVALPTKAPVGGVDLALLDSGVLPSVGSAVYLSSSHDVVGTPGLHEHGTAMALLARQVAPQAGLHDVRVLEAGGAAGGAALARGLDHALFTTPAANPLVLNLSLGWPAELSRTAVIQGRSCTSQEDPFGESVRYVLDVARRIDDEGERRVFISAAAGNRARAVPADLFPPAPAGHVEFACGTPTPGGPELFLPGEYSRAPTCAVSSGRDRALAHATAAVDADHRIAIKSIAGAETPLVAPGQHITVTGPGGAAALVCSTGQAFPPPVTLPATLSGSSVAAVLVSASAARVQRARLDVGAAPLNQPALERLLYLTGRSLCRNTATGVPVRELNVGRLDAALDPQCEELVACAVSEDSVGSVLLAACGAALVGCGLEAGDETGALALGCTPPSPGAVGMPATYTPPASCTARHAVTAASFERATCHPNCPDDAGRNASLLGSLGPQPGAQGCPSCFVELQPPGQGQPVLAILEIDGGYEPGTAITNPILVLTGETVGQGQPATHFVDLLTVTSPGEWHPGAGLYLDLQLPSLNLEPSSVQASLQLQVQTPDAKFAATDVSPLEVIASP